MSKSLEVNELSKIIKIVNYDSEFTAVGDKNYIQTVKTTVSAIVDGKNMSAVGVAHTHPDDLDFATKKTGIQISSNRAAMQLLLDVKQMGVADNELLMTAYHAMEEEVDQLIQEKEKFYDRIRRNRAGDNSNKVRILQMSEDGKSAIEL